MKGESIFDNLYKTFNIDDNNFYVNENIPYYIFTICTKESK